MWKRVRRAFATDARPWFAALFLLVIALNAAIFPKIDSLTQTQRSRALSSADTGEFLDLAFSNGHSRTRFELYYVVGEIAPGAEVVLADSAWDARATHAPYLHYLGDVSRVEVDAPVSAPSREGLERAQAAVVAAGDGGTGGPPWRIALDAPALADAELAAPGAMLDALRRGVGPAALDGDGLTLVVFERPVFDDPDHETEVWVVDRDVLAPEAAP